MISLTATEVVINALARHPDRIAFHGDDRDWTYRETLDTVHDFMAVLTEHGLGEGSGLAVLSTNRPEAWALTVAIQAIGGFITPLHPLSAAEEHVRVLNNAQVGALVVEGRKFAEVGAEVRARIPELGLYTLDGGDESDLILLAQKSDRTSVPPVRTSSEGLAAIHYTGGTTGEPKGVEMSQRRSHAGTMNLMSEWPWPKLPITIICTPITHMGGAMIVPTLIKGGSVVLREKFAVPDFCAAVARWRVNTTFLVPTVIYALLDGSRDYDLSSLEMIGYGSAPMSPTRLAEALDIFGPVFVQGYGSTEVGGAVIVLKQEDHRLERPDLLGSAGTPGSFADVALLDDDDNPVGEGEPGEICIRGPATMERYWRNPAETEKVVRNGWVHSGDIGTRNAEGYIFIVDRKKDMIISGGFNVYPKEIENVLSADDRVSMAAVIGVPHERWGEAVHAFVALRPGVAPSEEMAAELLAAVRVEKGAVYTPKVVHFSAAFPVTAVGKLDKRALRVKYWQHLAHHVD